MRLSFDELNKTELATLIAYHRGCLKDLENIQQMNAGCRGCLHRKPQMAGQPILCKLAGDQEPPADVQSVGCEAWSWDSIPF